MTITKSPSKLNMQQPRGQTSGWAAFDRKQREGAGAESNMEPFPSINRDIPSGPVKMTMAKNNAPLKSFSSAVRPSLEFPSFVGNNISEKMFGNSGAMNRDHQVVRESSINPSVKQLKHIHSWAGDQLIEDILAGVNNDVNQASSVLKAMVSIEPRREDANPPAITKSSDLNASNGKNNLSGVSSEEGTKGKNLLYDSNEVLASNKLLPVPVEPEWEEDDVYLSHRKDALRMMRMASQHSKAASNAFLRGDHASAHQLSSKAREERMAAEELNNKAAEQIFRVRNGNNGLWKLDLHGLHASEAVNALKDRLHKLESYILMNRSASSDISAKLGNSMTESPPFKPLHSIGVNSKTTKLKALSLQRPSSLSVITGTGTHSRGQAALPAAVRSFLVENEYRFEDARPGVLDVHPKFRHK